MADSTKVSQSCFYRLFWQVTKKYREKAMNDLALQLLAPNKTTSLFYIGQAGFVLMSKSGMTLGIDLYLSDCVERFDGFKRLSPKVMDPDTILDYIAASHWHLDHFDIDAMPLLMGNWMTRLLCTEDCREHVNRLHLDERRITYIKTQDSIKCGDFTIHAVFCDHGVSAPFAVGFVIETDGFRVYYAGDTALRLDKAAEIAKLGPFDLMLAPINGAFGNLNEHENVKLCAYHQPSLSIPCHFWTFAEHHGNPGIWIDEMKAILPEQKYLLMAPGERFILDTLR